MSINIYLSLVCVINLTALFVISQLFHSYVPELKCQNLYVARIARYKLEQNIPGKYIFQFIDNSEGS